MGEASIAILVLASGRLHDAIEAHELMYNQLSHSDSFTHETA
jgi:hypothetical protein